MLSGHNLRLIIISLVMTMTSVPVKAQSYMENLSRGLIAVRG